MGLRYLELSVLGGEFVFLGWGGGGGVEIKGLGFWLELREVVQLSSGRSSQAPIPPI